MYRDDERILNEAVGNYFIGVLSAKCLVYIIVMFVAFIVACVGALFGLVSAPAGLFAEIAEICGFRKLNFNNLFTASEKAFGDSKLFNGDSYPKFAAVVNCGSYFGAVIGLIIVNIFIITYLAIRYLICRDKSSIKSQKNNIRFIDRIRKRNYIEKHIKEECSQEELKGE